MSYDIDRFHYLICRCHVGELVEAEFAEFEATLKASKDARDTYRKFCRLDTLLRRKSEEVDKPVAKLTHWKPIMAAAAVLVVLGTVGLLFFGGGDVAHVVTTENAVWSDDSYLPGEMLKKGTKLELASGTAQIQFQSGAITNLTGPAVFKVKTRNSGYLYFGAAQSVASSPESNGFVVGMPVASVVDTGTAFKTKVGTDQSSLVFVTDGNVGVDIGRKSRPLKEGMGLNIQAGNPTIIYQIEKGKETTKFEFPNVESPSNKDYADQSRGLASIKIKGRMGLESNNDADPESLTNGRGQASGNSPEESFYFKGDEVGSIIFDLGKKVPVSKVNTYSWYENSTDRRRSFQHFYLWGYGGDEAPDISDTPALDGWVRITEVNSDDFFGVEDQADRPAQLVSSIEGAAGNLGKYRFLYFDIRTSTFRKKGERNLDMQADHTLFGEIDIYIEGN